MPGVYIGLHHARSILQAAVICSAGRGFTFPKVYYLPLIFHIAFPEMKVKLDGRLIRLIFSCFVMHCIRSCLQLYSVLLGLGNFAIFGFIKGLFRVMEFTLVWYTIYRWAMKALSDKKKFRGAAYTFAVSSQLPPPRIRGSTLPRPLLYISMEEIRCIIYIVSLFIESLFLFVAEKMYSFTSLTDIPEEVLACLIFGQMLFKVLTVYAPNRDPSL